MLPAKKRELERIIEEGLSERFDRFPIVPATEEQVRVLTGSILSENGVNMNKTEIQVLKYMNGRMKVNVYPKPGSETKFDVEMH